LDIDLSPQERGKNNFGFFCEIVIPVCAGMTKPPRRARHVVVVQSRKTYLTQQCSARNRSTPFSQLNSRANKAVGRTESHEFRQRTLESRNCAELVPAYQYHPPSAILTVLCGKTLSKLRFNSLPRGQKQRSQSSSKKR